MDIPFYRKNVINRLIEKHEHNFPTWTTHKIEINQAVNLFGINFFKKFDKLDVDEQDIILSVMIGISKLANVKL